MAKQKMKGAKGSESAVKEGLASKEHVNVKDMHQPSGKAQRPKKGSDRI